MPKAIIRYLIQTTFHSAQDLTDARDSLLKIEEVELTFQNIPHRTLTVIVAGVDREKVAHFAANNAEIFSKTRTAPLSAEVDLHYSLARNNATRV